jgi:mRNA interferase RelE/StbE
MWSANLAYRVEFDPEALRDLKKLDRQVQQRLVGILKTRVGAPEDPRAIGEALAGAELGNYWKYRVGDWRVICDIQDDRIVVRVLRLGNRREIYR